MIKLNDYTYCEPTDEKNIFLVVENLIGTNSYFMDDEEIYKTFGVSV